MTYERFTDRAKKVMALANQEAQRFNHEYVGTEHVLLGLIKDGTGISANVLKNRGISLQQVRQEVEKLVRVGPETITMGRLPLTPHTQKVLEYAREEAQNLNQSYVGLEHILLGLLREPENIAAQVLTNLGVHLEAVRREVLDLLGHGNKLANNIGSTDCSEQEVAKSSDIEKMKELIAKDEPRKIAQNIMEAQLRSLLMQNELDDELEAATREKEAAVANQDFEKALEIRKRIEELNRKKKPTVEGIATPDEFRVTEMAKGIMEFNTAVSLMRHQLLQLKTAIHEDGILIPKSETTTSLKELMRLIEETIQQLEQP